MTDPILSLKGVSAGYGATHVLNDVSFDVARGERLAVIGRNGVGKTTTLATIMGLTRVHSGEIAYGGRPITRLDTHSRSRLGLGLVPQTRDIFPSLTVEENLLAGAGRSTDLEKAYDLSHPCCHIELGAGSTNAVGEMEKGTPRSVGSLYQICKASGDEMPSVVLHAVAGRIFLSS